MSAPDRTPAGRPRVLLAVFLVGLIAVWITFGRLREGRAVRGAWPQREGAVVVEGLRARVQVLRDERGIPHIRAASESDALRALGFVHAQDRLAQMVWLSRVARGRAAELAGPAWVDADRRARQLGIARHAEAQAQRLDARTRRALEAYAEGVNARMERIRSGDAGLPRPLAALRAALEPWTPADTLAVVKLRAWGLADPLETTRTLLALIQKLGGVAARPFFPEGVGIGAVPLGTQARFPTSGPDPLRVAAGLAGPGMGSSAWVVGGSHAAGGKPLLAADLHLEPTLPAGLYEVHLRGGSLDAAGATLPGAPVLWCGRNPHVAWAAVHARAVVADLFEETLDPEDPGRFHDGRRLRALEVHSEEIQVRGGEPIELEVRETGHGPIVAEDGEGGALTLAWSGAHSNPGLKGLLDAARARSAEELLRALRAHREPVVAVAYADVHGASGVQVAGWVPQRRYPAGLVPVPGRSAIYEWSGPVATSELPHAALRRGRGWLVAADNPLPGAGAASVEWLWRPGVRAARIDLLLREATARGGLDATAMASLQADLMSAGARELVHDALALVEEGPVLASEARQVAALLRDWDGGTGAASVGAAVYHVFVDRLLEGLFREPLGDELLTRYLALPHLDAAHLAARLLAGAAQGGTDPGGWDSPERVATAVRDALRGAWLELSVRSGANRDKWTWGRLHRLRFRPLLPLPRSVEPGLGPFEAAGDGDSVAATGFTRSDPFDTRSASILRFAVDLAEPGHALSALAPGQSEHPGDPHRESGLRRWLERRPGLLLTSPLLVDEAAAARLRLEPAP